MIGPFSHVEMPSTVEQGGLPISEEELAELLRHYPDALKGVTLGEYLAQCVLEAEGQVGPLSITTSEKVSEV